MCDLYEETLWLFAGSDLVKSEHNCCSWFGDSCDVFPLFRCYSPLRPSVPEVKVEFGRFNPVDSPGYLYTLVGGTPGAHISLKGLRKVVHREGPGSARKVKPTEAIHKQNSIRRSLFDWYSLLMRDPLPRKNLCSVGPRMRASWQFP